MISPTIQLLNLISPSKDCVMEKMKLRREDHGKSGIGAEGWSLSLDMLMRQLSSI
jgi:hypothetical protein